MKRLIFALLAISVLSLAAFSQNSQWRNFVDSKKDVWFQAPDSILIDRDDSNDSVTLYSFFDGISVSVRKESPSKRDFVEYVKRLQLPFGERGSRVQNFNSPLIYVRREEELIGEDRTVTLYVGSKNAYFVIRATASKTNAAIDDFVKTIRFQGSRLISDPNVKDRPAALDLVTFDTLAKSVEADTALARKDGKSTGTFAEIKEHLPLELDKLSRNIIILRKPRPSYTDQARMNNVQGTILANVQFLASGEIGSITVNSTADRSLAKNVISVIRQIKFIPAQADGKPVDVVRTLVYKFSIY